MFKFTSLSGFLALQLITHCLFSPNVSSATSVTGTFWGGFDGVSPADESSAYPMPVKGQCALECQGHTGCQGFFYNDVSRICVTATSESDSNQTSSVDSGFRYYMNKYTCPLTTSYDLFHIASSSCFAIIDTPKLLWFEARDHCSSTGGQLAVLDTRGKVDVVMDVIRNNETYYNGRYHLGARRPTDMFNQPWPASGQDFVWLNGQPLDVAVADGHWFDGDPNNSGNENVIQLFTQARWIDAGDSRQGYICQYSLV